MIGEFIDRAQEKIPTMGQDMLTDAVAVLCTLEESRLVGNFFLH